MSDFVGVDWAAGRWVVVEYGPNPRITTEPSFLNVWAEHSGAEAIIVDIPIGLAKEGRRDCDVAARGVVGPRSRSVFAPPAQGALNERDYYDACAANAGFNRLGSQAWWLVPTIREVQVFLDAHPETQTRVHEGHPEVSFADLDIDGRGLEPKSSDDGREQRVEILEKSGLGPETNSFGRTIGDFVEERRIRSEWHHRIGESRVEDVLDAAILALTAKVSHDAGYPTIPEDGDIEDPPVIVRPGQRRANR